MNHTSSCFNIQSKSKEVNCYLKNVKKKLNHWIYILKFHA